MAEHELRGAQGEGGRRPDSGGRGHGLVIVLVVLIIVAGVVTAGIAPRERAKTALKAETFHLATPTVNVIHLKQGAPQEEIVLPGNMQAFVDSPIYARTNGYLKKWYHDIGAHVKAGDLLLEIDSPEVDQQLDQARADLNTAEANMKLAQVTAKRYEDLESTDSVSQQDVDNARSDYAAKKAMAASAEHNVLRLEQLQSFEKVYAPFDGIITARNTDVGYLINSGNGGTAQELFHMAAIKKLRVFINVPQQYSVVARPGLTADLTLAEFPGRRFRGTLARTANAIALDSRTLLVEVDVENPTGELLPGAYTEVHLKLPQSAASFLLPVTALIFQSAGLQVAEVDGNNRAEIKSITLGRDFGGEVEVTSGVNGNENIIDNPPDSLVAGEQVQIARAPAAQGGRGK